ncbi:hypothetical protein ACVWXL_005751 [Bradyrhizobium sp. GM22.5]
MKLLDKKPAPDRDAADATSPRPTEIREILEEYAHDLREIIRKLRGRLN